MRKKEKIISHDGGAGGGGELLTLGTKLILICVIFVCHLGLLFTFRSRLIYIVYIVSNKTSQCLGFCL